MVVTHLRDLRQNHGATVMPPWRKIGTEYILFGAAGLISLLAFGVLILAPAVGSSGAPGRR